MKTASLINTINEGDELIIIKAPGSKSEAIRYIIGAFLCNDISKIYGVPLGDDVVKTIEAIEQMGALVEIIKKENEADLIITGIDTNRKKQNSVILNAGSSATLFRIIAPISLMLYEEVKINANPDLLNRPMDEMNKYMDVLIEENSFIISNFDIKNQMVVDGSVSSQYASGLLFALSLIGKDSELIVDNLKSKDYLTMTKDALNDFGIEILQNNNHYSIKNNIFTKVEKEICIDYSQVSHFLVLAACKKKMIFMGLEKSNQPDIRILSILRLMGLNINNTLGFSEVKKSKLKSIRIIDVTNCIDLAPILFVVSAYVNANILFVGTERLAYKESNRIKSMQEEFAKIGIELEIDEDKCVVKKHGILKDDVVFDSHNDHRICMALTILSLICNIKCKITGVECVNKSYPNFFDDLKIAGYEFDIK